MYGNQIEKYSKETGINMTAINGIKELLAQQKDSLGIHEYGFTSTSKIVFSSGVRFACESNVCGEYGRTWACPPGVGTLDECRGRIMAYSNICVLTTKHELEDSFDWDGMMAGKAAHQKIVPKAFAMFQAVFQDIFILSTESCQSCDTCTYPDAPCRFPEKLHPSIESYGVEVNKLAAAAGVHYINGVNTVTYFSCILF